MKSLVDGSKKEIDEEKLALVDVRDVAHANMQAMSDQDRNYTVCSFEGYLSDVASILSND